MARLGRQQPNRPIVAKAPVDATVHTTIGVTFTLTATATKHVTVAATLPATFTLTATATKSTGIGLPRRRRPWQLVAGPAAGGHTVALTKAKGRKYVARLTESSELTFAMDGRHPQAASITELATDIHVLWTSPSGETREVDRLRVGDTGDSIDISSHTMNPTCLDYRAVLGRRELFNGATLTYTATDQAEIAWALIAYTQGLTGGALGISKGWAGTTPTGINRDRTFTNGDSVGERVQDLSDTIDGFDWAVLPANATALIFQVWYPQRGVNRGVVLEYGGLVTKAQRQVNTAEYGNALRYSGADTLLPQERQAADLATRPEGRWDLQLGDTDLATLQALSDRSDWQIVQSQVITPVWTVTLKRGSWEGPDHIWLGDSCRLVVKSGRLDVDTTLRVFEVSVEIGDDGDDVVQLTLGGPKPDYRRRPTLTERRLTTLEKR